MICCNFEYAPSSCGSTDTEEKNKQLFPDRRIQFMHGVLVNSIHAVINCTQELFKEAG